MIKKVKRDINIIKNFKKELNLNTQVLKSKKIYSRKKLKLNKNNIDI